MLVRITASYDDMARSLGFNGDDGRHLLELQHADLVRKIRHGMLREDRPAEPAPDAAPRFVDASGAYVDPAGIDDPGVRELLNDLGAKIDEARHPESARRAAPPGPAPGRTARPRWRRVVVRIRLPF